MRDRSRHASIAHIRPLLRQLPLPERLQKKPQTISTPPKSLEPLNESKQRRTLRYFVRSYVTSPTTMSAITEMPANTPRPIGSTISFLPGIWNAAAAVALADGAESAAALAEAAAAEAEDRSGADETAAPPAMAVPEAALDVGAAVAVAAVAPLMLATATDEMPCARDRVSRRKERQKGCARRRRPRPARCSRPRGRTRRRRP